jgi:hypothetical protein
MPEDVANVSTHRAKRDSICGCVATVLALAGSAHARAPTHALEVDVQGLAGAATAPFFTSALPEAKGGGMVLVFGGFYRAQSGLGAGLYVPATVTRLREPSGADTDEPSWGNPMFWGERRFALSRDPLRRLDGWVRIGVGAPLADMGPRGSLTKNRALAVADALDGFRDREFFTPGVVPFALASGVVLDTGTVDVEGSVKLVPMVRIDDAFLPAPARKDAALVAVANTGGSVWPFPELGFGARASLSVDAAPAAHSARESELQLVLAPTVLARAGHTRLETELVVPVAGALGGKTIALGFRAAFEW